MITTQTTGWNHMTSIINRVWEALHETYEHINDTTISFDDNAYDEFKTLFTKYYNQILKEFMIKDTKSLDEHKQTAIIIISTIESGVIKQTVPKGNIPLAPYVIALHVGLSFLLDRINERLKASKQQKIEEFILPLPLACDTPYFETLCRILYYEDALTEKENITYPMSFNIVEWSDRLFLLEYILLQSNKINPESLRSN